MTFTQKKLRTIGACGLLLLAGLTLAGTATAAVRALVVGINDYTSMRTAPAENEASRSWRDLRGAVNDAQAIQAVLQARFRVPEENIQLLTAEADGQGGRLCSDAGCPTRKAILQGLEQHLLANAQAGDTLLFFYAGHGSQVAHPGSGEQDEFDESLVPMDAVAGAADIRDKELRRLLNRMIDRGARPVVIVDACHSGSISRGQPDTLVNSRELEPIRLTAEASDADNDAGPVPSSRGAVVLSAASPAQLALERRMPDDSYRGGFSFALLKALMSGAQGEPLERTFQRTEVYMKGQGLLQAPQLDAAKESRARPLIAKAGVAFGQDSASLLVGIVSVDDGSVVLRGGKDLGLYPGTQLRVLGGADMANLEVTENLGLTRSKARLLPGAAGKLKSGDLAAVTRWSGYPPAQLQVWIPFVPINLPGELLAELRDSLSEQASIGVAAVVEDADYELACAESADGTAQCAWRLPKAGNHERLVGLPVVTDSVVVEGEVVEQSVADLTELASRLARLKAWLSLASPPAELPFPYTLQVRHAKTGEVADLARGVELGERYRIVLASTAPDIRRAMIESKPRYVYVGGIDSRGNGYLLYPRSGMDFEHCEQLPCRTGTQRDYASEYVVFEDYLVTTPDTDLLYLVTSDERFDPNILSFDGVRSSEVAQAVMRSGATGSLSALLAQYAGGSMRSGATTPLNWSIEHFLVRVVSAD